MKRIDTGARFNPAAILLAAALLVSSVSGCVKIRYDDWIEAPAAGAEALLGPIRVDYQASYVEVASDAGGQEIPTARYDRVELLSALTSSWNAAAGKAEPQPARAILIVDLVHAASDAAGIALHSIFGVSYLLGLPHSCATAHVTLVLQTPSGTTLVGKSEGHHCSGLYYPSDHKMAALADGINEALAALQPVEASALIDHVPRLPELGGHRATAEDRYVYGYPGLYDRVIWWVQPTKQFPQAWGETP